MKALLFYVSILSTFFANAQTDVFGITQFYQSKPGFIEWTSQHWNNGIARSFNNTDSYDPTDWTEDHSSTSTPHEVDGNGIMKMSGKGPRFHINPNRSGKVTPQDFTNIEFTAYYRRLTSGGKNWGGMVVGMRGSSCGHGSSCGNDCNAQCYQARFRNDGKWDFEKEWKHPGTTYYSSQYGKQDKLWGGDPLPLNKWIGMKYIMVNINNNTDVRLRVYIDSTSNGNVANGGNWVLVGDVTDNGSNWQGADISGCSYTDPFAPILGGGNVYWRTDQDEVEYKMVTIREIDPTQLVTSTAKKVDFDFSVFPNPTTDYIKYNTPLHGKHTIQIRNSVGQVVLTQERNNVVPISTSKLPKGMYYISIIQGELKHSEKLVIR